MKLEAVWKVKEQLRALLRTGLLTDAAIAKEELHVLVQAAARPETNNLDRTVCGWRNEIEVLIVTAPPPARSGPTIPRSNTLNRPRLPQARQLQISYSHENCRPDGGTTLIR